MTVDSSNASLTITELCDLEAPITAALSFSPQGGENRFELCIREGLHKEEETKPLYWRSYLLLRGAFEKFNRSLLLGYIPATGVSIARAGNPLLRSLSLFNLVQSFPQVSPGEEGSEGRTNGLLLLFDKIIGEWSRYPFPFILYSFDNMSALVLEFSLPLEAPTPSPAHRVYLEIPPAISLGKTGRYLPAPGAFSLS